MKIAVLTIALVLVSQGAPSTATQAAQSPDAARLAQLVAKGHGPYTKLSDSAWSTPYQAKTLQSMTVNVAAAEGGVFFFVRLFDRKKITLSQNLLIKLAELNGDLDYAKIVLDQNALMVRVDARSKLLDDEEFQMLENQTAAAADEAYAAIKAFVQ